MTIKHRLLGSEDVIDLAAVTLNNQLAVTKGGTGLATIAINNLLYASALDTIAGLATGNNGVLVTGATGIPAIGTDLPTAVTIGSAYIHRVGGTDVAVADGGTGKSSWTQWLIPYADTTTSFAQIPIGASGQVLTSNGAGVAPTFQAAAGGGAPTDAQYVTLALDATLTAERVLTGTTNQVIITDGGAGGNVTLSTPQNIHTGASPTFVDGTFTGALTVSGLFTINKDEQAANIGVNVSSILTLWPSSSAGYGPAIISPANLPLRFGTQTGLGAVGWVERVRLDENGNFVPATAGGKNLGTASLYWNDVSYKTLTDRGCLGSFDLGVEMPDGSIVTDVEALKLIKVDPLKQTVYGVPRFDYASMPKAVYKPAPIADKDIYRDTPSGQVLEHKLGDKMGEDGAEMTSLLSIMLGAIKELDANNLALKARVATLEAEITIIKTALVGKKIL